MLELLWLLFRTVLAALGPRQDLVAENLLLRHQLAVLTRPTRTRLRARLRIWDKLVWILARRFCGHWREHLAFVTPDTVVRWHRQGWRLFWRWKSHSPGGRPHLSPEVRDSSGPCPARTVCGVLSGSEASSSSWASWSATGRCGGTAGGLRRASSQTWRTFLANYAPGHKQRRRILRAWARHDAAARLLAAAVAVDGYLRVKARRSVG